MSAKTKLLAELLKKAELPMDRASRMARADELFPNTAYHGTSVWGDLGDIHSFDPKKAMSVFNRPESLDNLGVWVSDNPTNKGAGMYAPDTSGAIYPLRHGATNLKETSFAHIPKRIEQFGGVDGYREHLKSRGYDGIRIKSRPDVDGGEFEGQDAQVIFDPSKIRSLFADFDPAKKESSNLLASAAPAAVGLGALAASDDSEAGATGLMAKLIKDSQDDSTVRAPKNPKTAMLATMLRDGERAVEGSPAEFVYPSGLAPWLERLAYDEEPSKLETAMAIADFIP